MNKTVTFKKKPNSAAADAWVESRADNPTEQLPMKRLTIDIPASLHREIKAQCAQRGAKMADEIRELLLKKYRKQ